jgi:glycosyltransferase involved in cell wall biosynthesis
MACGTPVVATRVGGNTDVIDSPRLGRLVGWNDAEGAGAAIGELLSDPDLRRAIGRAGRDRILANFTLAAQARRMENLFASLAGLK